MRFLLGVVNLNRYLIVKFGRHKKGTPGSSLHKAGEDSPRTYLYYRRVEAKNQGVFALTLLHFLSDERLAGYRAEPNEPIDITLERYLWNLRLCSAFYVPLHVLEIGFRNTVYQAFAQAHGPDWLRNGKLLAPGDAAAVQNALSQLQTRRESTTVGKIIAELSFGFWTSLLTKRYESSLPMPTHALFWPKLLSTAFPHMPRHIRTRKNISIRLDHIRKLRNRVFHHEPIWKISDLVERHREIVEAVGWISPDGVRLLKDDWVLDVIASKPKFI